MQPSSLVRWITVAVVLTASVAPCQGHRKSAPRSGTGDLTDPKTGEFVIRYAVHAPSRLSAKRPVGLIVCLHGTGGDESELLRTVWPALVKLDLTDRYVIVGFKSRGVNWQEVDHEPVRQGVVWALETYPIDRRRVFGWGYSSGGTAWPRFNLRNRGVLAGIVVLAGTVEPRRPEPSPAELGTQFYHIHGDKDAKGPIFYPRKSRSNLERGGYRLVYREVIGAPHNVRNSTCDEMRLDAMAWCHALRQRSIAPSESEAAVIQTVKEKLDAGHTVPKKQIERLGRIGGPEAGLAIAMACRSAHASVRAAAVHACGDSLFGAEVMEALAKLLENESGKKTRAAALDALGRAANWQYPEAQRALCARAADATHSVAERGQAIAQLARLIPMDQLCNFKSWLVWDTLLDLLMDPSAVIRKAAFGALMGKGTPWFVRSIPRAEPPSKNGFGYSPKASDSARQKAADRWRQWLAKVRAAAERPGERLPGR